MHRRMSARVAADNVVVSEDVANAGRGMIAGLLIVGILIVSVMYNMSGR